MRFRAFVVLVASLGAAGCAMTTKTPASGSSGSPAVLISDSRSGQDPSASRGRGRNGGLPPGIAKNLSRGKPLPAGIAKQQVPGHVLAQLPRLEDGFEYVLVAGKILLVEIATQIIHDILVDAVLE